MEQNKTEQNKNKTVNISLPMPENIASENKDNKWLRF